MTKPEDETQEPLLARVVWEGDSLETLRSFPATIRREFGIEKDNG